MSNFTKSTAMLTVLLMGGLVVNSHLFSGETARETPGQSPLAVATFAGGCFWSMEEPFEKIPGVMTVVSGYTGGFVKNPTYKQVSQSPTGHVEAIEVRYDPRRVSYDDLLEVFWRNVDPTDAGGQFADRGNSYRTAIFVHDEDQRRAAESSKERLGATGRFKKPIVTPIVSAKMFYPAEEYHQDFYKKQPAHHQACRVGSGRASFQEKIWGDDANYAPRRAAAAKFNE